MIRRTMVLFALALMFLVQAPAAPQGSGPIVRVTIDGVIHPIAEEYVSRAIDQADATNAAAVLIVMRTPGGLMDSMRGIIEKIMVSKAPVIVFVSPSGARAASAGFFILESADIAAMSPGTNAGAAHPVFSDGSSGGDVMKAKMENDAAAYLRSYVGKHGRNVEVAETAVRDSKAWSDQEALQLKLIDVDATDQQDLFKQLDGREITRFNGTKSTLHLVGVPVVDFNMSLKQNILSGLMDPNVSFLVLAIGALCLYFEFNHPGAVIPGVVGLIAILLAIFALNLLPVRFAAITMIVGAFVLFALEAKFATHGIIGIGGVVMLTLGGLLLVDGPIPEMRVKLLTALAVSIPLGLITVFLMSIALKARRNKVTTGVQGLVGEIGVARTELSPAGKVFVHGELWNAWSPTILKTGDSVKVKAVRGLELEVEEANTKRES